MPISHGNIGAAFPWRQRPIRKDIRAGLPAGRFRLSGQGRRMSHDPISWLERKGIGGKAHHPRTLRPRKERRS
jgi:hypothetical protein